MYILFYKGGPSSLETDKLERLQKVEYHFQPDEVKSRNSKQEWKTMQIKVSQQPKIRQQDVCLD